MENKNNKSGQILNTSANLLGLCFIVLTSLKVLKLSDTTIIDEFITGALFFFMISSILSFLSMWRKGNVSVVYENVADIVFLFGLITLFIITLLIAFSVI